MTPVTTAVGPVTYTMVMPGTGGQFYVCSACAALLLPTRDATIQHDEWHAAVARSPR